MDWLPFVYSIFNKPHGARNDASTSVRGSIPFEVEQVTVDRDNPAVIMLNQVQPTPGDYSYSSHRDRAWAPSCELTYYRTEDGRLVRPVYFDDGTELSPAIAMEGRAHPGAGGCQDYPVKTRASGNPFALSADDEAMSKIYRVTGDDRDEREIEAREKAAGLMRSGDCYFKEVPEPVVEIQFRGMIKSKDHHKKDSYDKRGLILKINIGGITEVEDDSLVFRMDEYDLAHDIIYEIAGIHGKEEPVLFGELYQCDGDAIRFDAYPRARTRLAAALDGLKRSGFGAGATVENVQQWCDLMRMMVDVSFEDAEVADAAREFYDALPAPDSRIDLGHPKLLGVIRRYATTERQQDPEFEMLLSTPGL